MKEKATCFIITPIGDKGSEIRKRIDELIDELIAPALEKSAIKLTLCVPHRNYEPENITHEIISHLLHDKLVIANLSGLNPNVMYELGLRHATALPLVIIAENGTKLPFDTDKERTLFYDPELNDIDHERNELVKAIDAAFRREGKDNTVTRVAQLQAIKNSSLQNASDLIVDLFKDLYFKVEDLPNALEDIMESAMYRELNGYSFKTSEDTSTKSLIQHLMENGLIQTANVSYKDDYKLHLIFPKDPTLKLNQLKKIISGQGIKAYDFKEIKGRFPPY